MFALPLQQAVLGTCPAPPQPCSSGLQRPLTVDMTWKDAPLFARGNAETRIYYNDSAYLPVGVTPFMIIPWHLITVVGALLALFVLWRIVRRRRHGGRRVRVTSTAPSPWMAPGTGV